MCPPKHVWLAIIRSCIKLCNTTTGVLHAQWWRQDSTWGQGKLSDLPLDTHDIKQRKTNSPSPAGVRRRGQVGRAIGRTVYLDSGQGNTTCKYISFMSHQYFLVLHCIVSACMFLFVVIFINIYIYIHLQLIVRMYIFTGHYVTYVRFILGSKQGTWTSNVIRWSTTKNTKILFYTTLLLCVISRSSPVCNILPNTHRKSMFIKNICLLFFSQTSLPDSGNVKSSVLIKELHNLQC